jgi:putative addiction module component (TIGR02574 family)
LSALPDVTKLTVAEKIRLIDDLWNSLPDDSAELELPIDHKRILEARLADHRLNPQKNQSWENVKKQILKK